MLEICQNLEIHRLDFKIVICDYDGLYLQAGRDALYPLKYLAVCIFNQGFPEANTIKLLRNPLKFPPTQLYKEIVMEYKSC